MVLAPIALLDSLSLLPVAIVPMILLMSGAKRVLGPSMFLAGIVAVYFPFGLLTALGLEAAFANIAAAIREYMHQPPPTLDLVLQLLIGLAMVVGGYWLANARGDAAGSGKANVMFPSEGFLLGATLTLTGLWGAFPYFAAIDQILRADIGTFDAFAALAFYNLVFVAPFIVLVLLRLWLGTRADGMFHALSAFCIRWGKRLVVAVLLVLGVVLVADAISWFFGSPLVPLPPPPPVAG